MMFQKQTIIRQEAMTKTILTRMEIKSRTQPKKIRVFIVEDHHFLRDALKMMFNKARSIAIVGESDNGVDAVARVQELRPDVCIMDITMKGLNGIDATRQILARCPDTRVLAFSASLRRKSFVQMMQAGASGYMVKTCSGQELIEAVRMVARGKQFFSPEIVAGLFAESTQSDPDSGHELTRILSPRELTVIELIAQGKSSKEIADIMALSVRTVEAFRMKIIEKTGASSVAEIVRFAIKEGITSL
jgi:DNA-binding NarL/FixJ family response regulator